MPSLLHMAVGTLVVLAAGYAFYLTFREKKKAPGANNYQLALERWIEGDLAEASSILYKVVQDDPDAVEPFLQLGNLLRIQGDPQRAAVLHRGLTLRPGLTLAQKIAVGLALAEDLNALGQWEGARDVLDSLPRAAYVRARYWKARFHQWHGLGNRPEAARTLRNAPRECQEKDRPWFVAAYASYQLDRALAHALKGDRSDAKARLKDVRDLPGTQSRSALVRAVLAAVDNDAASAVAIASDSLLDSPDELEIFLPLLQEVLLQSGQFARSLPILERACQSENAPPSLWIDLAMLYEKLGHRAKALHLLEGKAGQKRFTPDDAAPYLKMLVNEAQGTDFAKVWKMLSMPRGPEGWVCRQCGRRDERIRWFCPACLGFQTYDPGSPVGEVD